MRLAVLCFLWCSSSCFSAINGTVVSVADGDTITILTSEKRQVKVRLVEIDAPERGQAFGQRAQQALASLVAGKSVTVNETGTDRYKRVLGFVLVDDINVNYEMVKQGMAWCYTSYLQPNSTCPGFEKEARSRNVGLWVEKEPTPPWKFRRSARS